MRAAVSLLVFALSGCLLFDEPDLGEDEDDPSERVDCFADLPDEAADELLPGACERIVDVGSDGTTDSTASYRYDAGGRRITARVDATLVSYAYDEAGNLELTEIDFYIDGEIDSRERRDYACFEGEEQRDPGEIQREAQPARKAHVERVDADVRAVNQRGAERPATS